MTDTPDLEQENKRLREELLRAQVSLELRTRNMVLRTSFLSMILGIATALIAAALVMYLG